MWSVPYFPPLAISYAVIVFSSLAQSGPSFSAEENVFSTIIKTLSPTERSAVEIYYDVKLNFLEQTAYHRSRFISAALTGQAPACAKRTRDDAGDSDSSSGKPPGKKLGESSNQPEKGDTSRKPNKDDDDDGNDSGVADESAGEEDVSPVYQPFINDFGKTILDKGRALETADVDLKRLQRKGSLSPQDAATLAKAKQLLSEKDVAQDRNRAKEWKNKALLPWKDERKPHQGGFRDQDYYQTTYRNFFRGSKNGQGYSKQDARFFAKRAYGEIMDYLKSKLLPKYRYQYEQVVGKNYLVAAIVVPGRKGGLALSTIPKGKAAKTMQIFGEAKAPEWFGSTDRTGERVAGYHAEDGALFTLISELGNDLPRANGRIQWPEGTAVFVWGHKRKDVARGRDNSPLIDKYKGITVNPPEGKEIPVCNDYCKPMFDRLGISDFLHESDPT